MTLHDKWKFQQYATVAQNQQRTIKDMAAGESSSDGENSCDVESFRNCEYSRGWRYSGKNFGAMRETVVPKGYGNTW